MVFPVVLYGCESWTIKKAEHQRIDAFELWYWRRLLRVTWTSGRSNQTILKEISPGCSLEGLMLKLKLQYFGNLIQRASSLEKTLVLGKIEARRRRGCHPIISSSVIPFSSWLQSFPGPGSFLMSWLFVSGCQSIGVSASASVLPMNIQD